jgi:lipoprotein-releasing system permease protein
MDMRAETITQRFMGIFEWLNLLDKNVQIILGLILIVASMNIISILLILIMERVQMIGVLKAIGATNGQIRRIFIFKGMLLIAQGMFWGNVVGLGFCALQYFAPFIPLDAENYYMNTVPIAWNIYAILGVNILAFGAISLVLLLPTLAIARIQPIRAIKFD